MKTLLALFLFVPLSLAVVSCDDDDDGNNSTNNIVQTNNTNTLGYCGDSQIRGEEECDDGNRIPGDGCSETCQLEYSCGDGVREFTEECDGTDLANDTCVMRGYLHGTLTCSNECTIETSGCSNDATGLDILAWYKLDSLSGQEPNHAQTNNLCIVHYLNDSAVIRDYPSKIGGGIFFDGAFDLRGYMDCGPGYYGMDEITVEAWIEVGSYPSEFSMLLSSVSTYDATGIAFYMGLNTNFKFEVGVGDWDNVAQSTTNIVTREWHHVAFSYDGSEINIYVDGQLDSTTPHAVGPIPALSETNSRVYIASNYLDPEYYEVETEHFYTGALDELKIWGVARTEGEICADAGGVYDSDGRTCSFISAQ